ALRRFATIPFIALTLAGCGSGGAAEARKPVSIYSGTCNESAGKPATIILDCNARTTELMRLDWKRWGGSSATATGQLVVCQQDCAMSGSSESYRVVVTVRGLKDCPGDERSYTQLDYRPTGTSRDTAPPAALGTHTLGCEPAATTPAS
ncbi:MAG: hypothetical protein REI11_16410, partial [Patulibacter sp.]|nr:hypothetical protein [Patulibacter sp.]